MIPGHPYHERRSHQGKFVYGSWIDAWQGAHMTYMSTGIESYAYTCFYGPHFHTSKRPPRDRMTA